MNTCIIGIHDWHIVKPDPTCGGCYEKGECAHQFRVCSRCGKWEGYGSHGKLRVIPTCCDRKLRREGAHE